jgi:hypothetical protein
MIGTVRDFWRSEACHPRLHFMVHRLISIAMLMLLILQGVAFAAVDVFPASQSMEHCAGHENSGAGCACCSSEMMGVGCAAQCAVAVCVSTTLPVLSFKKIAAVSIVSDAWVGSPSYTPLNPPPIA